MVWLPLLLTSVVAVGLIFALGLPVALALRLRGFAAVLFSVAIAFAVLATAPIAADLIGMRWSIFPALLCTATLTAAAVIWSAARSAQFPPTAHATGASHRAALPLFASAIGGTVIASMIVVAWTEPEAISQTWDAIFHLNAAKLVLDTGSASPFGFMTGEPDSFQFYPAVWHGLVAIIAQLSGATVPLATNAATLAVAAVVWPIGAVALGRAVAGPSARTTLVSGILSAAFPTFPVAFLGEGTFYPNLLSTALLVYAAVGVLQLLAISNARRSDPFPVAAQWAFTLAALVAMALAHPNGAFSLALWLIAPLAATIRRGLAQRPLMQRNGTMGSSALPPRLRKMAALLAVPALPLAMAAAWLLGQRDPVSLRPSTSPASWIFDLLGAAPGVAGAAFATAALTWFGLALVVVRRREWWLLGSTLTIFATVYLCQLYPATSMSIFVVGPWYGDIRRLNPLIVLWGFPLAVLCGSWLIGLVRAKCRSHRRTVQRLLFVALLCSTQLLSNHQAMSYVQEKFNSSSTAPLLNVDERALLSRLEPHVPSGSVVAAHPWNGSALAYALSGTSVTAMYPGENVSPTLASFMTELKRNPAEACLAASELGVSHVLDFGMSYFRSTELSDQFDGISGLFPSPVLREMDREGEAVLFELICE